MATRHNFGFLLLDRVSREIRASAEWKIGNTQEVPGLGRWETYLHGTTECHLLWPLTFMNLSGQAVEHLLRSLARPFDPTTDLLVVIDDLSLPLGRVRLRARGSSGGHNGLKSVEAYLQSADYPRLKLGIGQPESPQRVVDYVLEPFSKAQREVVERVLDFTLPHTLDWLMGAELGVLTSKMNGWSDHSLQS